MNTVYSENLGEKLEVELIANQNKDDAVFLQRFFKTGEGQYGEGDHFLGLRVPLTRSITKKYYKNLSLQDLDYLISSKWHEVRMAGLVAMVMQYPKSQNQTTLYNLYISQIGLGINNWDLVDISCPSIVGAFMFDKSHTMLFDLATEGLWQKRVSIISTFYFLRKGKIDDTYKIAEILVNDTHDLIQKAVGWALREMGKVDNKKLTQFLDKYAATIPRTALRYSLEKQPTDVKQYYMGLKNAN